MEEGSGDPARDRPGRLAEGILVVAILFAVAWGAWTALTDTYSPLFRLLYGS